MTDPEVVSGLFAPTPSSGSEAALGFTIDASRLTSPQVTSYIDTLRNDQGEREETIAVLRQAGVLDKDTETSFVSLNIPSQGVKPELNNPSGIDKELHGPNQVMAAVPSPRSITDRDLQYLRDNLKTIDPKELRQWRENVGKIVDHALKAWRHVSSRDLPPSKEALKGILDGLEEEVKLLNDIDDELKLRDPQPESPELKFDEPSEFRKLIKDISPLVTAGIAIGVAIILVLRAWDRSGGGTGRRARGAA